MFNILAAIALTFALQATPETPTPIRLVAFQGDGCGPCIAMRPVVARLERSGVRVERIDIDDKKAIKRLRLREPITAVPTFVAVRGDRELGRIRGKTTFGKLRKLLGLPPAPVKEPTPAK